MYIMHMYVCERHLSANPRNQYQLDCGKGSAVRQWRVTTTPSVEYTCCAVAPSDGEEAETETTAVVTTGLTTTPL